VVTEEGDGHSRAAQTGEIDSRPDVGTRYGLTSAADPAPPTSAAIAAVRGVVLHLCVQAVHAGRPDIASELRAAIGPLADAESAARWECQASKPDTCPHDHVGRDAGRTQLKLRERA
jgi:hypothetical protein